MPILQDIPVVFDAEEIVAGRDGRQIRPALLRDAEEAIALGQTLWRPVAVYDWFEVREVDGEQVQLASRDREGQEMVLRVGPKAGLLAGARQALVGVGSIGPALEQRVNELQASSEGLKAYLLDSAGVVALGAVGEALRCLAEETAAQQGWGVGAALSPGSLVGWPLRGQRELCALLPLEVVGVYLNAHYVLEPYKSFSAVIGLGPGYTSTKVGSVCRYCALKDTCWRRREDPS